MANATALGMKSLAVHMEEDGATNDAIEVAFTAVQGLRPKDESDVDYRESQPNLISFKDLNSRNGDLRGLSEAFMYEYVFYTNCGSSMAKIMNGLALSNGGKQTTRLVL